MLDRGTTIYITLIENLSQQHFIIKHWQLHGPIMTNF